QALVAVEPDEQLGRDVAEQGEHARAVDELARVVRVVRAHAQAEGDREPDAVFHGGRTILHVTLGRQRGKLRPPPTGLGVGGGPRPAAARIPRPQVGRTSSAVSPTPWSSSKPAIFPATLASSWTATDAGRSSGASGARRVTRRAATRC